MASVFLPASRNVSSDMAAHRMEVDDPKWCRVRYVCVFFPQIYVLMLLILF
jgi:hypothetical protein